MKTEAKIATIVFIVVLGYIYLMKDNSSENKSVNYESVETFQNYSSKLTIDTLKILAIDSIKKDTTSDIQNKLFQFLKFKENRDKKERERIYKYLNELIENGSLKIDSVDIEDIIRSLDSLKLDNLEEERIEVIVDSLSKN